MSAREPRTNRTDYTILGCLSLGAMSGYDVKKLIDQSIGHFWNESYGQIYPALRRLEEEGLITGRETGAEGARRRREYAITERGLLELRAWLALPPQPDVVRYETSLKLFFGAQLSPSTARSHVERYREQQRERLAHYRAAVGRMQVEHERSPHLPYWSAVVDGGIRYARMAIAWCDATLERLDDVDDATYPVEPKS